MAIYILCAAAFGHLKQLLDSYHRAAEQLQNTATRFKELHSISAARCNLTFAAKGLPRCCKSAANSQRFCGAAQRCSFCTGSLVATKWHRHRNKNVILSIIKLVSARILQRWISTRRELNSTGFWNRCFGFGRKRINKPKKNFDRPRIEPASRQHKHKCGPPVPYRLCQRSYTEINA